MSTLQWHKKLEAVVPDEPKRMVNFAIGGPVPYRIYGRYEHGNHREKQAGWFYRAEYQLETGWWPLGKTKLFRESKALIEADAITRFIDTSNARLEKMGTPEARVYHEIQCPSLTKSGPCTCTPVIVD